MVFDNTGRFLLVDDRGGSGGAVLTSTGDQPSVLFTSSGRLKGIAVDGSNQIFTSDASGTIRVHTENGALVDNGFVTGLGGPTVPLAFGPGGPVWGDDLYTVNHSSNELLRIDAAGGITVIGIGFTGNYNDAKFGPDEALYLSVFSGDEIIRIAPPVGVNPDVGGNTGAVSVTISGTGFEMGATAKLTRVGEADIVGAPVAVLNEASIATTFDLTGAALGSWNVVAENPSSSLFTLEDGFTIEEGRAPELWVDVLGRGVFRAGRVQTFHVMYGNRGNVDAIGVPLWLAGVPSSATLQLGFEVLPPEPLPGSPVDFSQVPTSIDVAGETVVPLLLPVVPPNFTGVLRFQVTVPNSQLHILLSWLRSNPAEWFSALPNVQTIVGFDCQGTESSAVKDKLLQAEEVGTRLSCFWIRRTEEFHRVGGTLCRFPRPLQLICCGLFIASDRP